MKNVNQPQSSFSSWLWLGKDINFSVILRHQTLGHHRRHHQMLLLESLHLDRNRQHLSTLLLHGLNRLMVAGAATGVTNATYSLSLSQPMASTQIEITQTGRVWPLISCAKHTLHNHGTHSSCMVNSCNLLFCSGAALPIICWRSMLCLHKLPLLSS